MDDWKVEVCRTAEEYRSCVSGAQEKGYKILMVQYVDKAWVVTLQMPNGEVTKQ